MMTYTDLLHQFKTELNQAIVNYQRQFRKKPVPRHRAQDIVELLAILSDQHVNSDSITWQMMTAIDKFNTGLHIFGQWIYATGKSKLKTALLNILQQSKFSHEAFLQAQVYELKLQVTHIQEIKQLDFSLDDDDGDLREKLSQAQVTIRQLSTELDESRRSNTYLNTQLRQLRAQNSALYDTSQDLRQRIERLQNRLGISQEDDCESLLSRSPSKVLYGSFKSLSINSDP